MPVTVQSIEKLLKYKYADTIADQVGFKVSELHEKIKSHQKAAGGSQFIQPIKLSLNGGVAFSNETDLPDSATAALDNFKVTTKNIFGSLMITLKALRANGTAEKIVNLLNTEMDDLVRSVRFHKARSMEGMESGVLATVGAAVTDGNAITVGDTRLLEDGMVISLYTGTTKKGDARIKSIDHAEKKLTLDATVTVAKGDVITNVNSLGQEYTGLGDIFNGTSTIYGVDRKNYNRLVAYQKANAGAINDIMILDAIADCEHKSGTTIDFINCSYDVISKYVDYKQKNSVNVATMDIEGGYKSLSFNGLIPMVKSRFAAAGSMDLLDTSVFQMLHLGKPGFVEGKGGILVDVPGKAAYVGTFADFSELYCSVPGGQGRLTGITAAQ